MTPKNMWRTSPLFATMGIALPGGIAAKKDNPDRQVWNIMGDGAFNMCYPDVITNVQYDLPVINVVFSNGKYAFIKDKYEDTNKHLFGCDFPNADYAKIAEAQGAVGFTVDRIEDIDAVVAEAVKLSKEGKTVVIDARITPHRPLPVEVLELDPKLHSEEAIKAFKENTKQKNSYHSASSWKKKVCNHAQLNNSSRRKSNVNCVIFTLPYFSTACGSMPCLFFDFLRAKLKDQSNPVFLWRIVNEFKSIRYYRFRCSPSLC